MTTKTKRPSRLVSEMQSLATDMRANGTMDEATYRKITMREYGKAEAATLAPLSGEDIRALREQAHMSQAVFAKHLNLTVGYISQLEREVKRPTGPALALLDIIRRKGIEVIL
ncbi:MAG: helix-turn-helix domain-containing protein [Devosia sp.]|nr:helix-turn-helix domain-containing protein [Devosia sp.]